MVCLKYKYKKMMETVSEDHIKMEEKPISQTGHRYSEN